ncbi:MAG: DEAD/DEAH box helicase family protein [Bacteroidota bacterium]|nr:DEAD/DEAH box helicase family protein [Bacteroidota bacterium]
MLRASQKLQRLEAQLLLLGWANLQFGFKSNQQVFDIMKDASEGYDSDGRSHVAHMLGSREACRVPAGDLVQYDNNVRQHLESINHGRRTPITLRYFQQLAALYAELFLHRRAAAPRAFALELSDYFERKAYHLGNLYPVRRTKQADLNKLAFWMATGSGKTLIMHLNYLQILHYSGTGWLDNILLITPNEGLSAQHIQELAASGIPSARFGGSRTFLDDPNRVWVTEITKLVDKRRGRGTGVSIEVQALGDRNLVFVDEGHRGASGEAWRKVRDKLAKRGFTFEYSATFGQALAAAKDNRLTRDYGKSIVFDYSYRYFHRDGFGKDFSVLNVSGASPSPEVTELLLLGNLLSFYEQLRAYLDSAANLKAYNLEQPLWVFVGGSVNAVYKLQGRDTSDVLTIQQFLHRVLSDPEWACSAIRKLLLGESELYAALDTDLFNRRFSNLATLGLTPELIYGDILRRVFHAEGPGGLRLCDIRGASGEIGLKAVGSDDYFGLTYIGDTARFRKLVQQISQGITLEQDAVGGSVFSRVNESRATVNVLIGAKKFVEGWNSWRVSNMGLMNVGRAEGSEIIQLFGRGVRLKGRGMSLKRSTHLEGAHPHNIDLLETLNIFAVRADYMKKFREYMEREGLEAQDPFEIRVPIRTNNEFLRRGLIIPRLPAGADFTSEANCDLDPAQVIGACIDRSTRGDSWVSGRSGQHSAEGTSGLTRDATELPLQLVDWERAYLKLTEALRLSAMRPLAVPGPDSLESFLKEARITVTADGHVFNPKTFSDCEDLQELVHSILRFCADKCWRRVRQRWEGEHMRYGEIDDADSNLAINADFAEAESDSGIRKSHYIVRVQRDDAGLCDRIVELIAQQTLLYEQESRGLPRIYFDRHLYQPLLVEHHREQVQISPPPLNRNEARFVADLRKYWQERGGQRFTETELFVLRNQARGQGVGFTATGSGFYPDFILWMISGDRQRVVFVEPHGMRHAPAYEEDEKARLHERLPALAEGIALRSEKASNVSLDSFIVSATRYGDLRSRYGDGSWTKEDFARRHILFPDERGEYIETMLTSG